MMARGALAVALATSSLVAAASSSLSEDEVKRAAKALGQVAAETQLFLEQVEAHTLTDRYARIHREKLAEQRDDEAKKLVPAAEPDVTANAAKARELAQALGDTLQSLDDHLHEPAAVAKGRAESERIGKSLQQLAGSP
jgi:hypothetical protein